ncbi:MAG: CesT family type III secretion system chaperone [Endozoicomonadaceae bacterium]|nr:CesT family type III secretion system chaperone [Endozoicomonadaceae bacterium]MCY4329764.1 CesT family type III secretion system chaperone [Endozoicomonadaceae bacterium]
MNSLDLLNQWTKYSGIHRKQEEQNERTYTFMFGERFPVSVEAPAYSDDIFITIELAEAGTGYIRRRRFEIAMNLNAYALETRGGTIGWDSINKRIILAYRVNTNSTKVEILDNMIANLIEVAENLQPLLALKQQQEKAEAFNSRYDALFQPIACQQSKKF